MKTMTKFFVFAAAFGAGALVTVQAQTIADWTFETTQPGVVDGPASPGAGVWITNILAEVGSGTASGFHAGAATYSSPAGNGSVRSFSSALWAVGDFYQFETSTLGLNNITLSYDQVSSGTGPGTFQLAYSTDGVSFTSIGTTYTVLDNGLAPNASWNATTANPVYTFSDDLSAITAIDNAATVYFRLIDSGTEDAAGTANVGTGGTDRVDNFTVAQAVPEPASIALAGLGVLALLIIRRRRS